jgi:hypothetical protein
MIYPEKVHELPSILQKALKECTKKQIVVHAMKSDCAFRVQTKEGDYKSGKAGDYLMCGIEGELYICDGDIFDKTYDFLPQEAKVCR